jgi:hypothetical protein
MCGRLGLWLLLSALTPAHASASAPAERIQLWRRRTRSASRSVCLGPSHAEATCADLSCWHSLNFDKDRPRLGELRKLLDASNADLSALRSRGGKLLMYLGWADMALSPAMGIDYYEKAAATNGADTPDFFRLFMVPEMFH